MAPVFLLVRLQLGALVLDCADGTRRAVSSPQGPHPSRAGLELLRRPGDPAHGTPRTWVRVPRAINSGAPTLYWFLRFPFRQPPTPMGSKT